MRSMEVDSSSYRERQHLSGSLWEANFLVKCLSSKIIMVTMLVVVITPLVWNFSDSGAGSNDMDIDARAWNLTESASDLRPSAGAKPKTGLRPLTPLPDPFKKIKEGEILKESSYSKFTSMLDLLRLDGSSTAVLAFGDSLTHGFTLVEQEHEHEHELNDNKGKDKGNKMMAERQQANKRVCK